MGGLGQDLLGLHNQQGHTTLFLLYSQGSILPFDSVVYCRDSGFLWETEASFAKGKKVLYIESFMKDLQSCLAKYNNKYELNVLTEKINHAGSNRNSHIDTILNLNLYTLCAERDLNFLVKDSFLRGSIVVLHFRKVHFSNLNQCNMVLLDTSFFQTSRVTYILSDLTRSSKSFLNNLNISNSCFLPNPPRQNTL